MTKKDLCKIICDLTGWEKCNEMILRQIHKYVTEHGWDYKDIARAFAYFVEVEGNTPDPKYGIAIVKFKMDEARKYYDNIELQKIKQLNEAKKEEKITVINVSGINCTPIKRKEIDITKF